jgi:U3 small nucleolar RNA-associated protein 15
VLILYITQQDYIRAGEANKASPNVITTGGYDHRVIVWDVRMFTPIMNLDHGAPVESLVIYPDGGSIISAGVK